MACYMLQTSSGGSFDDGPVKIGTSRNVPQRMLQIQRLHHAPIRLIRDFIGGIDVERWLHERFASLRLDGEWFEFSPEMLVVSPPIHGTKARNSGYRHPVSAPAPRLDLILALERAESVLIEAGSAWGHIPGEIRKRLLDAAHAIQNLSINRVDASRGILATHPPLFFEIAA